MLDRIDQAIPKDQPLLVIAALLFGLVILFLPTLIALVRRHSHIRLVLVANILLSWTTVGWLGVLGWAATDIKSERLDRWLERRKKVSADEEGVD